MEGEKLQFEVRPLKKDEWEEAMALAWRTFQKFEAKEYSPEGVRNFEDFISDNGLYKMFLIDEYLVWVAVVAGEIIGMISVRSRNHISLLFVDAKYHHKGVGTALMQTLWTEIWERGESFCTVHSSPYAVGFYHELGFIDRGEQRVESGMIITPMRKDL